MNFQLVGSSNSEAIATDYYKRDDSKNWTRKDVNRGPGVVFDQPKKKMAENKAWATTATAKTMQAIFICMTHQLLRALRLVHIPVIFYGVEGLC